jgi:glutamyl-tRNA reductase
VAVVVVGVHEWDAPLGVFERCAVGELELPKALAELVDSPNLSEAVILSTCMRTEVYAVVERFHDGLSDLQAFFHTRIGTPAGPPVSLTEGPEARPGGPGQGEREGTLDLGLLSCWYDDAAVMHLFEVAAGIDSPVLGEGEVLRQVRDAGEHARGENTAGPVLATLFRHAVEAGKRARTETAIQRGTTSLAQAVVELAADRALGLERRNIVLVGAGEMGSGIARAIARRADVTGEVTVVNRGRARAEDVAGIVAGRAADLAELESVLQAADVVLTSTASGEVVLGAELIEATAGRRHPTRGPLVVVDAAVPRDVDPAAAGIDGIELLDVEDVRQYAKEQMAGREGEIPAVRSILTEELERYRTTSAGRLAAPVVSALRQRAEELRLSELERYRPRLEALDPAERDLVETVTRRVVAKLLHSPSVRVKEAAGSPRGERLAEALRALFDL